eukprot:801042_1
MSTKGKKDKKKTPQKGLDDYLHKKGEQWTTENMLLYAGPAFIMAWIPSFLYWGAYDYRPDGLIGIEYIVYIIVIGCTVTGLLSAYTAMHVDCLHFLKTSSEKKPGDKQLKMFAAQSKWWTLFYVNTMYLVLFFLANFYAFKSSIPSIHFRYGLATILPSAAVHLWVNG